METDENEIFKILARKEQVRNSINEDGLYHGIMIDVVKGLKSGGMSLSTKEIGYTSQDAHTFLVSESSSKILENKGKILATFGVTTGLTFGHSDLSAAIKGVLGMEHYAAKMASEVSANYLDVAVNYASSAEGLSSLMLGCVALGIIGAVKYTKKISDRNTMEENIATLYENPELQKSIQEHKEAEAFRLGIVLTNKYLGKFLDNSKNILDLTALSMHRKKKDFLCRGLELVFGEDNFVSLRKEMKERYEKIKLKIENRVESRDGLATENSYRKMFEDISSKAVNIENGLKSNKELDKKIKEIYQKIAKETYEEFLVRGVRDTAVQSMSKIVSLANKYSKNPDQRSYYTKIVKELKILQEVSGLSMKTSNARVSKYSLISGMASKFIYTYQTDFNSIKDKCTEELVDTLMNSEFDRIISLNDPKADKFDKLAVLFKETIDTTKPNFIKTLKDKIDNFITIHNVKEEMEQHAKLSGALGNQAINDFLNNKSDEEFNKKFKNNATITRMKR